jgi:hypothetical protein
MLLLLSIPPDSQMLPFRGGSPPAFSGGMKRPASAALAHSALPFLLPKTSFCGTLVLVRRHEAGSPAETVTVR